MDPVQAKIQDRLSASVSLSWCEVPHWAHDQILNTQTANTVIHNNSLAILYCRFCYMFWA